MQAARSQHAKWNKARQAPKTGLKSEDQDTDDDQDWQ